jgi:hypothetical protein
MRKTTLAACTVQAGHHESISQLQTSRALGQDCKWLRKCGSYVATTIALASIYYLTSNSFYFLHAADLILINQITIISHWNFYYRRR